MKCSQALSSKEVAEIQSKCEWCMNKLLHPPEWRDIDVPSKRRQMTLRQVFLKKGNLSFAFTIKTHGVVGLKYDLKTMLFIC